MCTQWSLEDHGTGSSLNNSQLSFFLRRCKLFYKKDNEFKEKGVGTLHLKPAAGQKTQLLVRADTNLGRSCCSGRNSLRVAVCQVLPGLRHGRVSTEPLKVPLQKRSHFPFC